MSRQGGYPWPGLFTRYVLRYPVRAPAAPGRARGSLVVVSPRSFFLVVLATLTLLHAVLAASLPVSGDEAYYWD